MYHSTQSLNTLLRYYYAYVITTHKCRQQDEIRIIPFCSQNTSKPINHHNMLHQRRNRLHKELSPWSLRRPFVPPDELIPFHAGCFKRYAKLSRQVLCGYFQQNLSGGNQGRTDQRLKNAPTLNQSWSPRARADLRPISDRSPTVQSGL